MIASKPEKLPMLPATFTAAFPGAVRRRPVPHPLERERRCLDLFQPLAGRGFFVDLLQVGRNDAGIYLRGGNLAMAQHFLNVAHAGPATQHLRRGRRFCRAPACRDVCHDECATAYIGARANVSLPISLR